MKKIRRSGFRDIAVALLCLILSLARVSADDIAFFYALDADLELLRKEWPSEKTISIGKRTASVFNIGEHRIYAVKMRSGCIETAVTAEGVMASQTIDKAFSAGPAGALHGSAEIGTSYAIRSIIPYQSGTATVAGFVPAESIALPLPPHDSMGHTASATLASGEMFLASSAERDRVETLTGADLVDMNLAGLLKATDNHKVPLVAVRVVSDHAGDQASEEFSKFLKDYGGDGAKLFLRWLSTLPENLGSPLRHPNLKRLLEGENSTETPSGPLSNHLFRPSLGG